MSGFHSSRSDRDGFVRKVLLYYHTARHLKPIQIVYRLRKWAKSYVRLFSRRFSSRLDFTPEISEQLIPVQQILARCNLVVCQGSAEQVLQDRFSFLNEDMVYKDHINWKDLERSRLWRFNLHYFDYAVDLGVAFQAAGDRKYYEGYRRLVKDWISQNEAVHGDGWHPYTVSRRVVNWIYGYILLKDLIDKDSPFRTLLFQSLHFQASYLVRNLEFDLLGNHLVANAKALFFAGSFFNEERWLTQGLRLLEEQADEQILPDGGHFERSPMYHCIVLMDYLDCLPWLARASDEFHFLSEKVEKMLDFLSAILLPNGEIPLFNDSASQMSPQPQQIFSCAEEVLGYETSQPGDKKPIWSGQDSGYYVLRGDGSFMIIDGGEIGPVYQPGHGHCDLFSYELCMGDQKMVVDSGVYDYEEGEMRYYCRSTRAHNTVMVDKQEQSEIWKSFRVGRRASPFDVNVFRNDMSVVFQGRHDGYRQLGGRVVHSRWIAFIGGSFWLILDEITGRGVHLAESFIHLYPEAQVSASEGGSITVAKDKKQLTIAPFGGEIHQAEHWYCPEFGRRYSNIALSVAARAELPVRVGYLLIPRAVEKVEIIVSDADPLRFDVRLEDKQYQVDLNPKTMGILEKHGA